MQQAATPQAVLAAYAELINRHDFSLLVPLIAEDAVFWSSSGSFIGIDAIRGAFERTWKRLDNGPIGLRICLGLPQAIRQRSARIDLSGAHCLQGKLLKEMVVGRRCCRGALAGGTSCMSI